MLKVVGTSWNIYNDKGFKIDYNHGFKNFKKYNNYPENAIKKFDKKDKK